MRRCDERVRVHRLEIMRWKHETDHHRISPFYAQTVRTCLKWQQIRFEYVGRAHLPAIEFRLPLDGVTHIVLLCVMSHMCVNTPFKGFARALAIVELRLHQPQMYTRTRTHSYYVCTSHMFNPMLITCGLAAGVMQTAKPHTTCE